MYDSKKLELKWQEIWDKEGIFEPKKDYNLQKNIFFQCFRIQAEESTWGMLEIIQ